MAPMAPPNAYRVGQDYLRTRIRVMLDSGATIGYVEDPLSFTFHCRLGEPSTLKVTATKAYTGHAPLFNAFDGVMLALEFYSEYTGGGRSGAGWREFADSRFRVTGRDFDTLDNTQAVNITGVGIYNDLSTAQVWTGYTHNGEWKMAINEDGKREFKDQTIGAIITTLVTQAQGRNALQGLQLGFTAEKDSYGNPWTTKVTQSYDPATDIKTVIDGWVERGIIDVWCEGNTVHIAKAGERARRHRGNNDEMAHYIINGAVVASAPDKAQYTLPVTEVLVLGDNGYTQVVEAEHKPGRGRTEVIKAGGVTERKGAETAARAVLQPGATLTEWQREWTYVNDARTPIVPCATIDVGDIVFIDNEAGQHTPAKVLDMSLSQDDRGVYTVTMGAGNTSATTPRDTPVVAAKKEAKKVRQGRVLATGLPQPKSGRAGKVSRLTEGGSTVAVEPDKSFIEAKDAEKGTTAGAYAWKQGALEVKATGDAIISGKRVQVRSVNEDKGLQLYMDEYGAELSSRGGGGAKVRVTPATVDIKSYNDLQVNLVYNAGSYNNTRNAYISMKKLYWVSKFMERLVTELYGESGTDNMDYWNTGGIELVNTAQGLADAVAASRISTTARSNPLKAQLDRIEERLEALEQAARS